jgi:protocatechuate 3,4-dioxygenase beta subunit
MSRRLTVAVAVLTAFAVSAPAYAASGANGCQPTLSDAAGPFGRGMPPARSSIGTGHVLTGVVVSSTDCRPLARARVELWQANRKGRYTRAGSATVVTDGAGRFRLQGPYPPSYEGRPPHIHIRIQATGHEPLLTRYVPARGERRGTIRLVLEPAAL